MTEKIKGWPCDYCGELDPDFESVCVSCYENNKEELTKHFPGNVKPKKKSKKND
jgi:hypothetical protein